MFLYNLPTPTPKCEKQGGGKPEGGEKGMNIRWLPLTYQMEPVWMR